MSVSMWSACYWFTYQAHWLHKGLFLYWGANPAFKLLPLREPVHWLGPSFTSRWCFNILTASMLFRDAMVGVQILVMVFWARSAGTYNTFEGAGPIDSTTRISRRELDKIKALFTSPETFVSVRPPSGWNLWLRNKIGCQRDMESQLPGPCSLLKAGL